MKLLDAQQLQVCLGKRIILKYIDLSLEKGELIGLIGANGVGKTTLLKALAGLLPIQSGLIYLCEKILNTYDARALSRVMAFLAQGTEVHWPMTVERVVALGRLPYLGPWQGLSQQDSQMVDEALRIAEINHLRHRLATQLSGGERRLVMLARALAGQPQILLADEPIAGLDPNHQLQVMTVLKERAIGGAGVMVVMHDLSLAARYCDRLVLLHEGGILAQGVPREVLSPAHLKIAYNIQAKYGHEKGQFYVLPWNLTNVINNSVI